MLSHGSTLSTMTRLVPHSSQFWKDDVDCFISMAWTLPNTTSRPSGNWRQSALALHEYTPSARKKKNDGQTFRSVLQICTHIQFCVCFFGGAIDIHNTDSRSDQP
jgi:hypothetical protein